MATVGFGRFRVSPSDEAWAPTGSSAGNAAGEGEAGAARKSPIRRKLISLDRFVVTWTVAPNAAAAAVLADRAEDVAVASCSAPGEDGGSGMAVSSLPPLSPSSQPLAPQPASPEPAFLVRLDSVCIRLEYDKGDFP